MSFFDPGPFAPEYRDFPEIPEFLEQPETIAKMRILSQHGSPAIYVFEIDAERAWPAFKRAKEESSSRLSRTKQMAGHAAAQVMEAEGFVQVGEKRFSSWLFTSGATFKDPDWRRWLYVHRNREDAVPQRFCIARRKRLTDLHEPPDGCSQFVFYRRCSQQEELEFVLDVQLADIGWTWARLVEALSGKRGGKYVLLDTSDE